jgi:serpin B
MYVFLPAPGSTLQQFEQELTPTNWGEWLSRFESRAGHVGLPRIQVASKTDIKPALKDIGLNRVFDSFAGLSALVLGVGAKLTSVSQSTALKVDERGTEAISVGILGGVAGGVQGGRLGQPPPLFEMIINRPFFFAIMNEHTKQLIFLGAVTCPNC